MAQILLVLILGGQDFGPPPGKLAIRHGQGQKGNFKFEGAIDGVHIEVTIKPSGNNRFFFSAEATGVDLTALTSPINVSLTIGNDTGLTSAPIDK